MEAMQGTLASSAIVPLNEPPLAGVNRRHRAGRLFELDITRARLGQPGPIVRFSIRRSAQRVNQHVQVEQKRRRRTRATIFIPQVGDFAINARSPARIVLILWTGLEKLGGRSHPGAALPCRVEPIERGR